MQLGKQARMHGCFWLCSGSGSSFWLWLWLGLKTGNGTGGVMIVMDLVMILIDVLMNLSKICLTRLYWDCGNIAYSYLH